jgi:hypothetical protein
MGNTWKVVVAFVGIFVAGTVFGGFFALGVGQRMIDSRRAPPPTNPGLMQIYVQQLGLSDEQKTKIKPILEKAQSDTNEIQRQASLETAAVIRPILEKQEADLKKLLTTEQSAKLTELQKSRDNRFGPTDRGGGRGNRGGGPGGNPNFQGGPGGRGQRGPGGPGSSNSGPGGGRPGFSGQTFPDAKSVPPTPVVPAAPAPAGN